MPKFKFDMDLMGKRVVVVKRYVRKVGELKSRSLDLYWESGDVSEKRQGWIIGYRHLNNGTHTPSSGYTYDYDYDPATFKTTSKIPCLLITYWPTQKPIYVPIDGFLDLEEEIRDTYPLYTNSGYGAGNYRKHYIELTKTMSKDFPRDSKGRFI